MSNCDYNCYIKGNWEVGVMVCRIEDNAGERRGAVIWNMGLGVGYQRS